MYAITDCRIRQGALSSLHKLGFDTILMPPADHLQSGVSSHTDMLIFIGFGRLFCHQSYYSAHKNIIDLISSASGHMLALSDEPTGEKYPQDVLFNACIIGKTLICNKKTVSKLILSAAQENGYHIISVSQGYTKCATCNVSDNAIITADKAIARACSSNGIDVLLINEGHVSLPPYEFGFIGGASGRFCDNIYFCGSLNSHPDGEKIKDFCKKHNKTAVSLTDGELQDVGSLFFI